jgi:hypothetical protein
MANVYSCEIEIGNRKFSLFAQTESDETPEYEVIELFDEGSIRVKLNKTFRSEYNVEQHYETMKMHFSRWLNLYEGKVKEYTIFIGKSEYTLEGFYNEDECMWEFYVFEITRYDTGEKMCTRAVSKDTFVPNNVPIGNVTDDISDDEKSELRIELTSWLFDDFVDETKQNKISSVWVLATLTVDKNYTTLSRKEEYFANEDDAVQAWKGSINTILDVLGKENFMQVGDAVTDYSYYRRYGYKANHDLEFVFDLKKQDIK